MVHPLDSIDGHISGKVTPVLTHIPEGKTEEKIPEFP